MTFKEYLATYPNYHRNPVNKALHLVGIPIIILGGLMLFSSEWRVGLVLFVLGWIGQFVGHWIEGTKPAFTGSPIFLLAAPVWYLQEMWAMTTKWFRRP